MNHIGINRRQIRGESRENFKKLLSDKYPEQIFEELVEAEDKQFLVKNKTTNTKSMAILGRIRSEVLKGQDNHTDPILDILAEINQYPDRDSGWIQILNAYPFYVLI